ncbi:Pyridoxal-5'-phosphate-dependent enzyme, beta subunit [Psychromonas ingrahamii 37]|uniref:Pyridoxal-5'-phosphate-dependent enzyme, beta subunit n=1 Tax=Psychromonas ingrahamii (strain DSM 17664 / CCUG 51855 / 37) TaxID=357804 RepID=A1SZ18_PSYIN|nr:Pyridoxal-5'-phosphate-dependent enzyme, beta subunit [Psychromonas ingrahamii 37]
MHPPQNQSQDQASNGLQQLEKKMQSIIAPSPLQKIEHPLLDFWQLTLSVKRDDLLHPAISGNKWRKLKYNLLEARRQQVDHIISFGGAYSNHIHALAAAGFYFGFKTTAIIRGESWYANNPTLKQALAWGMELQFVTRQEYKQRAEPAYLQSLQSAYPNAFIVPEGGSNRFALRGVIEALQEIQQQASVTVDHIITATGSGSTLAGLVAGIAQSQRQPKVTGIAVLKNAHYLNQEIALLLQQAKINNKNNWRLQTEFHHGGYAKVPLELNHFCEQFSLQTGIPVEPIYTGKMFYGLFKLIEQGYFNRGEHIVALHTGGLQGLDGLKENRKERTDLT